MQRSQEYKEFLGSEEKELWWLLSLRRRVAILCSLYIKSQMTARSLCRYCVFDLQDEVWDSVVVISKWHLNNKRVRAWGFEGIG